MTGIYAITSPTNKIYIGQAINIRRRYNRYSVLDCKSQIKLYNSLKKHGFDAHKFKVIHELPQDIEQSTMNNYELLYYTFYKDAGYELLNLKEAFGKGGKLSMEQRRKISERNRGRKYKPHSPEAIERNRLAHIGLKYGPCSEETKRKISLAQIGKICPPVTAETRAKLSAACRGKPMPEHAKIGISNWHKQKIYQYTMDGVFIKEWDSSKTACETLKLHRGNMCVILKTTNRYKGFKWFKTIQ